MLNAALLAVLALVTLAPSANAQGARGRAKGQYAMVSGKVQGVTESVIYIVDSANEQVAAARYDGSRRSLTVLGQRDLAADFQAKPGQGGAR